VVKLLGNQGRPEPVSTKEIESLRLALESGAPCSKQPLLQIGDSVTVSRGPLAGLEGRVLRMGNKLNVVINVASVCQAIAVEVPIDDVDTKNEAPIQNN